jgi:DNA polymerase-3 subunit chi
LTEVAFHFNALDKVEYACRLLRKAHAKGSSLFVLAEPGTVQKVESALWTLSPDAFIPHCIAGAPAYVTARTPIQIGSELPAPPHAGMLVNLQRQWVTGWQQFEKIFEIVTLDDVERHAARERLRRYRAEGVDPVWHEIRST